jgi:AcrR family transcriptional regulator
MGQPSKQRQRRREFVSRIAGAFIELGYRGTTTADLARRCDVRENVLYRVWPTKKAMFLDAVDYVYAATMSAWDRLLAEAPPSPSRSRSPSDRHASAAARILEHQAANHGRMRLYRIVFAGLTEDDADIRAALGGIYRRLHTFIAARIGEHRRSFRRPPPARGRRAGRVAPGAAAAAAAAAPADDTAAWAIIGLGAVVDILRELEIAPLAYRASLMKEVGSVLVDGMAR